MGNACGCNRTKSDDSTWDRMVGRSNRHNTAGKGPDGKVYSNVGSKYNTNPDAGKLQTEEYEDSNAPADGEHFNPGYYKITPKMEVQHHQDAENPDHVRLEVSSKMVYDPKNEIGKAPEESEQDKRTRLKNERVKQQAELEKIQKRAQGDFDEVLKITQQSAHNQQTVIQPVKASAEQKPTYQMVQPNAPAAASNKIQSDDSGLGEAPKKIQGLATKATPIFEGATLTGESKYAYKDIVIENSKWREVHKAISGQFTDAAFPANLKSLKGAGLSKDEKSKQRLKEMETFKFQRLSQVVPGIQVIVQGISPNDIFQGGLGDCYYMSSLSAVAETPQRIERNILQRTNSTKGAYCIAMCITGVWVPIVLDDMFPVRPDGQLAYSHTKHKEMWAMLFEKAYAKAFGGYLHIGCGGTPCEAIKDITGCPTDRIKLTDPKEERTALQRIIDADKKNFIMTVSSQGQGEKESPQGIISGHAYTLLGVKTLSNGTQLLQIRNPWGRGEWSGNWGDKSSLWTPEFKKQAGWVDADDGVFFMTYSDFKNNFETVTIGYYHDDYFYSYLQSQNADEAMDMKQFTVDQPGEYYLGVSQPSKYLFSHDPKYEYGYISTVIVRKLDNGTFKFIDGFASNNRDPWCKVKLEKGNYLALIYTNWESANTTYTFWTYGVKNTVIKKITDQVTRAKGEKILVEALTKKALENNDNWKPLTDCKPKNFRSKFESESYGYGFYVLDNQSPKIKGVEIELTKKPNSKNWQSLYPEKGVDKVKVKLGSAETKIVLYRTLGVPSNIDVGMTCSMKSS